METTLPAKVTTVALRGSGRVDRVDEDPLAVYLARLGEGSRRTMRGALDKAAMILTGGRQKCVDLDWTELRYQHVQAIRQQLAAGCAPATANKVLAAVRGILRECWKLERMSLEDYHKAIDVKPVKGNSPLRGRALSQIELLSLMSACASDPTPMGARDGAILAVLYPGGLRRAEAAALLLEHYDRESGQVTVIHGKGNKYREVFLSNGALQAMEDWLEVRGNEPGPLFFAGLKTGEVVPGVALSAQALWYALVKRREQAGLASFSPHDLRRTFISDLLDAGADISTVQQLAGHANVTTTQRYDRRPAAVRKRAAQLLHLPYSGRKDTARHADGLGTFRKIA